MAEGRTYPPMTARHKRVFALASVAAIAAVAAIALVRLQLIRWWIARCSPGVPGCEAAELAFEWWWVAMFCVVGTIAAAAHWITRDRLDPPH